MTTTTAPTSALTPAAVYQLLRAAGYSHSAAITQTAIGMAESSLRPDAVGDVGLQDNTWGPSVGIFQERTLKAAPGQPGYNKFRDPNNLKTPEQQAAAAYATSNGGTSFTAWTTFKNGAYIGFLPKVSRAIDAAGIDTSSSTSTSTTSEATVQNVAQIGPSWAPWNWGNDIGTAMKNVVFVGGGLALAVGLFVVGAWQASQPARDKARPVVDAAKKAGETAAVAA